MKDYHEKGDLLAERHVDFILKLVRPLMIAEFVHGYKHGLEENEWQDSQKEQNETL